MGLAWIVVVGVGAGMSSFWLLTGLCCSKKKAKESRMSSSKSNKRQKPVSVAIDMPAPNTTTLAASDPDDCTASTSRSGEGEGMGVDDGVDVYPTQASAQSIPGQLPHSAISTPCGTVSSTLGGTSSNRDDTPSSTLGEATHGTTPHPTGTSSQPSPRKTTTTTRSRTLTGKASKSPMTMPKKSLSWKTRGMMYRVPKVDREPWTPVLSRQICSNVARDHVLSTLHERGGWLIDPQRSTAMCQPTYAYVSPTPSLAQCGPPANSGVANSGPPTQPSATGSALSTTGSGTNSTNSSQLNPQLNSP